MRPTSVLLALVLAGFALPAAASGVRVVSSDDHGVTLELTVPEYGVEREEGSRVHLKAMGLQEMDVPGRPRVPFASALVGLPQGARVQARVIAADAEVLRESTRLSLGDRPVFRGQPRPRERSS